MSICIPEWPEVCDTCKFSEHDGSYWLCGNEDSIEYCNQVNVFHRCQKYENSGEQASLK